MRKLVVLLFLIVSQFMLSQTDSKKSISAKEAILQSNSFKERASWFTEMPQYNPDSSKYYTAKSIAVLSDTEPLHRNLLARLKFNLIKSNYKNLSLSGVDSIANTEWKNYKNSDVAVLENRILQYDFLVYWANIKLQKGEPEESLKLFEKALLLINKKDPPNVRAKMTLDKGLYYGLYGLDSEKKISLKYLLESLKYYKTESKKYPSEFYMINAELEYYYADKNMDSVKYYLREVKQILEFFKKPSCHIWYYSTAGSILFDEGKYEEARNNILKALKIMETYSGEGNAFYPYCLERLADIERAEKNYDMAILSYSKARTEYLKKNDYYGALNALKNIGDTYQKKGDLSNALKIKEQYYTESLASEKELNKRSLRESELKVAILTQEKELVRKSNQQIFYWIALGISSVILLLVYRNVRLKQKNNLKLVGFNKELESKNIQLDKRNAEIEILMKEIHHRVKNNLEVVSSLLALQSAQIDNPNTKEAMLEGQNRVKSIGIVHQKLYQGVNLGAVEMKDYFLNLSESILDSFGAEERVALELAMENLDLDIDTAVPLGLIINELLTNCIKYAFPKGEKGTITIKLEKQADNMLHLEVADNGVGKSGITHGTGFGGQLISLLTHQLNGTMREENHNGTTIIFDFKLKKSA